MRADPPGWQLWAGSSSPAASAGPCSRGCRRCRAPPPAAAIADDRAHVAPGHSIGSYPDDEIRADVTCEKKRDEWLVVYQNSRRLPPQLRCGPNGEFGSPHVYGRAPDRIAVEPAEQPASLAQEDP